MHTGSLLTVLLLLLTAALSLQCTLLQGLAC
jgi:hypothetical protein